MDYIIGVDIGTTSTKAVAFDLNGRLIAKSSIGYPILNPKPSWSEQDPEEIFRAVLNTIKDVVKKNEGNSLLGVSFSAAMHSLIAVDKNGIPLTKCIIWADTRSWEYADMIKNTVGHEIYMSTGTPIHPMSPFIKLLWLKENLSSVFDNAYKFISIKEYVFYKLFGKYYIDYSIASATGLFNIYNMKWNKQSLDVVGINEERLSSPVPATYIVKNLKSEYAYYMNIDSKTPFVIGASDGCLSNLGVNAIKPGNAAVTIGTSGAIRIMSDKPKCDEKERVFSYVLTENHYVVGGAVNNGGVALRWFIDNFASDKVEMAKKLSIDIYDYVIEKASEVPVGSLGLLFLPYILGERAPYWNANAKGAFFGININHKREHFIRAVLEGIIFGVYNVGKALEETTGKINTIYATGGFARSDLWVQILADVFNKKVLIADSPESSSFGAYILALYSLGIINKMDDALKMVSLTKEYKPSDTNHKVYEDMFKVFQGLYESIKQYF